MKPSPLEVWPNKARGTFSPYLLTSSTVAFYHKSIFNLLNPFTNRLYILIYGIFLGSFLDNFKFMVAEKKNFSSNAQHNFAKGKVISTCILQHLLFFIVSFYPTSCWGKTNFSKAAACRNDYFCTQRGIRLHFWGGICLRDQWFFLNILQYQNF